MKKAAKFKVSPDFCRSEEKLHVPPEVAPQPGFEKTNGVLNLNSELNYYNNFLFRKIKTKSGAAQPAVDANYNLEF